MSPVRTDPEPPRVWRADVALDQEPGPEPALPAPPVSPTAAPRAAGRVSTKRLRMFAAWSRQLLILIRSGMPLAAALAAVERQTSPGPWRDAQGRIVRNLEGGMSLAEAIAEHPEFFGPVSRGLIAAGEGSGQLDAMLERLADLTRQQLRIRRTVGNAMLYPSLLITVAVVVVLVMLCFVLPRFEGLFASLDVALPPTTKMLLVLSDFLRARWWLLLAALAAAGGAAWAMLVTPAGRRALAGLALRLPYVGTLRRSLETARITRLLGVLIDGKLPILEALALTRQACGNLLYAELLARTQEAVTRGRSISGSFADSPLIAPSVREAIHHGEQSGQTGSVLSTLADFMDEDNEAAVKTLSTVLEPMIMVVLGIIVAFIAISLFLPLFDLTSMTQR